MNYQLTLFKSLYDNKTNKTMSFDTFQGLEDLLYSLSKEPKESKAEAQLISPASYITNTTRANLNVIAWDGWAAVDVDTHKFDGDLKEELKSRYGKYYFVCYSTASSTEAQPKFRLVFPLTNEVLNGKIPHFWFALNTELGEIGDIQTKDLSRMYYIPGLYKGANNFIFTNEGDYMNPFDLMNAHPYIEKSKSLFDNLPAGIRDAIIKERKGKLTNTDIQWSNYSNCPFVSKKMIKDYNSISDTGWYHKMYQIMVSIAYSATKKKYPIQVFEIVKLCKEIDQATGDWYKKRPLETEAARALEYVMNNNL
jgi:hypothetical protein